MVRNGSLWDVWWREYGWRARFVSAVWRRWWVIKVVGGRTKKTFEIFRCREFNMTTWCRSSNELRINLRQTNSPWTPREISCIFHRSPYFTNFIWNRTSRHERAALSLCHASKAVGRRCNSWMVWGVGWAFLPFFHSFLVHFALNVNMLILFSCFLLFPWVAYHIFSSSEGFKFQVIQGFVLDGWGRAPWVSFPFSSFSRASSSSQNLVCKHLSHGCQTMFLKRLHLFM